MNNQLIVSDYMPIMNLDDAKRRYQAFKDFVESILSKGVDYGVIPGTDKPTLLKPGAEKLNTFFGLATHFEVTQKTEDWTGEAHGGEPFFYYWYRCTLTRGGQFVANAEGSCNSREKKYRWRSGERKCPQCGKPAIIKGRAEYGGGFICFAKKGGCGAKFADSDPAIVGQSTGRVPNEDIADQVNTLQKMAQKRALVAATLIGTNASEFFTQDVEDYIDADFTPAPEEQKQEPKAEPRRADMTVTAAPPQPTRPDHPIVAALDTLDTPAANGAPSLEEAFAGWKAAWSRACKLGVQKREHSATLADNISAIVDRTTLLNDAIKARGGASGGK